jgi:uncharacterized protein YjbI with pentapeptide repeats
VGGSLVGARLDDAELAQAVLTDCDASRSSLRRADLLGVTLERGVADGADLAHGSTRLRLDFAARVSDPDGCRRELVYATQRSRQRSQN